MALATPSRRQPVALIAALLGAACGRSGYDPLSGDGGGPGTPDATPSDAGIPEDGGLPADCGLTLIVTTPADEDDDGEVPEPPHLGDGLSLREAIGLANATAGRDCIGFSGTPSISYGDDLPALTDEAGAVIDGEGQVALSGGAPTGLTLAGPDNLVRGLELSGFDIGVAVEGDNNTLRGLSVHECRDIAIQAGGTLGLDLGPCLMYENGADALRAQGSVDLSVRHCTITSNQGPGIDARIGSTGLVVLNTIVAQNGDPGVRVDGPEAIATIDYVDLFGNQTTNCDNCTPGPNSISVDPLFTDPSLFDFTLQPESMAVDAGLETGLDVNGPLPDLYNGEGPDLGGLESP